VGPSRPAWPAYEELGVGVGVGVLVTVVPVLPVSPPAPVGDAVGLPVSVDVAVAVGDTVVVGVVVGDTVVVGVVVGDTVVIGVVVGDTVVVGVTVGVVDGVGVTDGDGVAQAGVADGVADGTRLGSTGSALLAEVDAPAPAATDVVSVPVKPVVAAAVHVAEGLGRAVAPALDMVAPGRWLGLCTPAGDELAPFAPLPLLVGEPLPSVRALPPPDDPCGMLSTVLLAWMIA
jgi:hypothetical protein